MKPMVSLVGPDERYSENDCPVIDINTILPTSFAIF